MVFFVCEQRHIRYNRRFVGRGRVTDYSAVLEGSDGAPKIVVRFVVWPKNPEKGIFISLLR